MTRQELELRLLDELQVAERRYRRLRRLNGSGPHTGLLSWHEQALLDYQRALKRFTDLTVRRKIPSEFSTDIPQ